jgi:hypothetical protein
MLIFNYIINLYDGIVMFIIHQNQFVKLYYYVNGIIKVKLYYYVNGIIKVNR